MTFSLSTIYVSLLFDVMTIKKNKQEYRERPLWFTFVDHELKGLPTNITVKDCAIAILPNQEVFHTKKHETENCIADFEKCRSKMEHFWPQQSRNNLAKSCIVLSHCAGDLSGKCVITKIKWWNCAVFIWTGRGGGWSCSPRWFWVQAEGVHWFYSW